MIVDERIINDQNSPYIIAELSANHGGDLDRAKKSIEAAARAGASAVKIQTYTPNTMTIDSNLPDFVVNKGLWAGKTLYELYAEAHTPFEWHEDLFNHAKKIGVTIFSTPFDESAVDLLESLNTPAYKIASFEIIDIPLIEYVAKKNKPIFISTGMASEDEVENAVRAVRDTSDAEILLFHCISSYPAVTRESNLNNLHWLKNKFGVQVGLSDHTTNNVAALTSIGMGAVAIEKHFKLDSQDCGPDSSFSLTAQQLGNLVDECNQAWIAKGSNGLNRAASESQNMVFRRSLYFVRDLKKGQIIEEKDIRRIRPGYGLLPKYFDHVLGKKVTDDVKRGDPVSLEVISN